jgi:hypothetical protein
LTNYKPVLGPLFASGTEGSNPASSSDESGANRVDLAHDRPARATGWYAQPAHCYFAGSPWQWGQFVASGIPMLWSAWRQR